jgi:DNA-binding NarL/FixJ family response regulator
VHDYRYGVPVPDAITVVIADDDASVRDDLRRLLELETDMAVVATARDGEDAVTQVERHEPDVAVMDIRMPGLDGITATSRIRSLVPTTKVLVVTTFDLDEYVLGAVRAGAHGFMLKHQAPDELPSAIRVVVDGGGIVAPRATARLMRELVMPSRAAPADTSGLTGREREVLQLIATGISNEEIAAALYVSLPTVKTHVRSLLGKIDASNRVQAVIWAYEHGLAADRGRR